MTEDEVRTLAAQRAVEKAFYGTPVGVALQRFISAHGRAWTADCSEHVSDRRLDEAWKASSDALDNLKVEIKKLLPPGWDAGA